jgi:hypothetical protein
VAAVAAVVAVTVAAGAVVPVHAEVVEEFAVVAVEALMAVVGGFVDDDAAVEVSAGAVVAEGLTPHLRKGAPVE